SFVMMMFFNEALGPVALVGIALLLAGLSIMSFWGGTTEAPPDKNTVLYALGTSIFIACYTITDGLGARRCVSAHSYAVWLFLLDALLMLAVLLSTRGTAGLRAMLK